MVDIAYIISHGFAARMVMQTNLLGKLVQQGKKVALISPDKNDENLVKYCQENRVELHEFYDPKSQKGSEYLEARKYYLEDVKNNTALWEKHIRATKYNPSKNPIKHLRPRWLYFIHQLIQKFPFLRETYIKKENEFITSSKAEDFIEQLQPKIVVATYPVNFLEGMLLKAAKKKDKKTIIHLLSWDNISCKGRFPALADEYIAWGPIMKEEFQSYYNIPAKKIHALGVPHFDLHLESKKNPNASVYIEKLGINSELPYIFFGMSSPRFAPKEIDIVEWIATEIKKNTFGEKMQFIIRPHPQNVQGGMADKSWLPRLKALQGNRVAVDFPDLADKSKMAWSMQMNDIISLSQLIASSSVSLN